MKIVVIGGTGLIGSKLVKSLRQKGHEAVAASPETGVNTITGEGVAKALAGAQTVVDVANSPSFEDKAVMEFFETSGRNLLAAEISAGVEHHIALSVVGTERLPESGYLRAKMAQENLIKDSSVPYTIVHSTQFFEFLGGIAQSATDGETVTLPSAFFQPISSDDVVAALAESAVGAPANGIVEIAGPEKYRMAELVEQYLKLKNDPRKVIGDASARYFGTELEDDSLVPGEQAKIFPTTFDTWLEHQTMAA
jgi:Predicted nucleoside-diphosphate-sugar epimerases